ncbi:beta-galactosidase small subunit family protein, partial [Streptacidiphilus carbonis]|uniref:beta-galactosidase small subunit family protein n=1 Tax=Streptacidiphilus carbonis TaxID=105422 RepID=UPI0005A97CB2
EQEGVEVVRGDLAVPEVPAGTGVELPLPEVPALAGESWLTVTATLAEDEPWGAAGHVVAWGQVQLGQRPPRTPLRPASGDTAREAAPGDDTGVLALGSARFDRASGVLVGFGGLAVDGPRLDVWRAPTDNDLGGRQRSVAYAWRRAGLDRMRHRTVSTGMEDGAFVVRSRVAPAATDLGLRAEYRWSEQDGRLRLDLSVAPEGDWEELTLPKLGLRMALPAELDQVTWYGLGPGESYRDSRQAARVGRFSLPVSELQTPYVMPQENGNRSEVRTATFQAASSPGGTGTGLRVEGDPFFDFTARRWTAEDLDAARHTSDLRPSDRLHLTLDRAHQGIGTGSCGPGALPQHRLTAERTSFTVLFSLT